MYRMVFFGFQKQSPKVLKFFDAETISNLFGRSILLREERNERCSAQDHDDGVSSIWKVERSYSMVNMCVFVLSQCPLYTKNPRTLPLINSRYILVLEDRGVALRQKHLK